MICLKFVVEKNVNVLDLIGDTKKLWMYGDVCGISVHIFLGIARANLNLINGAEMTVKHSLVRIEIQINRWSKGL